jgi:hypothetical protein
MRRVAILSAGAALVLALVIPGMAEATGRSTSQGTTDAASAQLDNPIVAQGKGGHGHRGGSHKGGSYRRGYRHGYRDGRHDGRHRHGYHRYGYYYGYPYYYGGYWGGGYGCNFDYPCGGPRQQSSCRDRGPDGKPPADSGCKYDQKCDCYYQSSQPPAQSETAPAPDQNAQPGPDQGQPPAPDQGSEPAPGPDQGGQPRPY